MNGNKTFWSEKLRSRQITLRNLIWLSFTLASVIAICLMGRTFYQLFSDQSIKQNEQTRELLISQINTNISSYIQNMMEVSDVLYYHVIKDQDLESTDFHEAFRLLYNSNKSNIKSIALFTSEGEVICAGPNEVLKEDAAPEGQEWFQESLKHSENQHFSTPHVQNLFETQEPDYEWVISLSRAVQLTKGGEVRQGVLLVDLKYSGFTRLLQEASIGDKGHIYVVSGDGELIYHPIKQQSTRQDMEFTAAVAREGKVGTFLERRGHSVQERVIKMVGYTGWYLVGNSSSADLQLPGNRGNLLIVGIFLLFGTILALLNSFVSAMVTKPFQSLERAVGEIEKGNLDTRICVSGVYEVQHFGGTLQNMESQLKKLMEDMEKEHEAKRKSELDTLQAQINPHFLYNTLDVIVWMISNEQKQEAAKAVMALARFFRISLSKGKNIITVRDEMEHVKNYLIIQKMRFKNRFEYRLELGEGTEGMATIKLVLQPLVENAIYHGMEYMDGDGEITVRAWLEEDGKELRLSVKDNGPGMTEEKVCAILEGKIVSTSNGSGIGVKNVQQRIQLYFGEEYGLLIHTEPDEGTEMILRMPAVSYKQIEEKT